MAFELSTEQARYIARMRGAWPDADVRVHQRRWGVIVEVLRGGRTTALVAFDVDLGCDGAAVAYAEALGDTVLDLALNGMGPDGHTASLFPGHPQLHATGIAVCVRDSPKPPPERMTLTLGKLNESRRILLVVTGEGKAAMLARVLAGPDPDVPASLLARDRLEVVADAAALGG
jgi:6-phosphogluconolactonase/glucosamine-6-phosphate isomerase/deaminase